MFSRMVRASLLHNRRRLTVALAAVLVPAALVSAVANFVLDARAKLTDELRQSGPNVVWSAPGPPPGPDVCYRTEWTTTLPSGVEVRMIGVDRDSLRRVYPRWQVDGDWLRDGCMVGARLADRLRLRPGMRLLDRTIDGIVETGEQEDDAILIVRDPNAPLARIDARFDTFQNIPHAPNVRVVHALSDNQAAVLGKLALAFGLVTLLVGAVSALTMALALASGVAQRRREFAVLRALGAPDGTLVRLLAAETGAVLAAGVALGSALGLALSALLGRAVFGHDVAVRPAALLLAALACGLVAAAGAVVPVRRALAIDPASALKEE